MTAMMEQNHRGGASAAAFFDLDGTLIRGSANIPLAIAGFKRGFVSKQELLHDLKNGISFLLKGASDERSEQVRDRILRAVEGHQVSEVMALADDFMDSLVEQVQPEAQELLDLHETRGDARVILSASPTEIVSRLAELLGMEMGIGTTAAHTDGRYNGELVGPFCYQEGKATILRTIAAGNGWDLADCYAYSDSISDLPMLEAVGHAVVVNPDSELKELALERGWEVVEGNTWRSMRKRDLPMTLAKGVMARVPVGQAPLVGHWVRGFAA